MPGLYRTMISAIVTNTKRSKIRSQAAGASTNRWVSPEPAPTMADRMNSPARAGSKTFPRLPALLAQKIGQKPTSFSVINNERQRTARSSQDVPPRKIQAQRSRRMLDLRISPTTERQSAARSSSQINTVAKTRPAILVREDAFKTWTRDGPQLSDVRAAAVIESQLLTRAEARRLHTAEHL